MSDTALFHYKCTAADSSKHELGIRWIDPRLNIAWPLAHPVISAKDAAAPLLDQIPVDRLFE